MLSHAPILAGSLVAGIWAYLLFARGWFWRVRIHPKLELRDHPRIAAIIPARNEAAVIARCVKSLLNQHNADIAVFVVDDHSSDGTAAIAQALSPDVTVIKGRTLPEGWTGKLWAVQQGIEAALHTHRDFLFLTDADIEHSPENAASLVAIAQQGRFDLASYMVRLHCESIPEKLLIPAFVFFFFKLYPPQWIANPHRATAGAAGGCILIRPQALALAGGIQSIRSEIIDDCALARQVKHSGGRIFLGLTNSAASIRPYEAFRTIEGMISRTAFNQLRHSAGLLAVAILGLVLTYVAPIALLFSGSMPVRICGGVALALMMVAYAPIVRFYRLNPIWTLTLPFAALFYGGATLHSAIRYWRGIGGEWKGRVQDRSQDRLGATRAN
jgi:hopene-associated glycosyltransferase HpnB